MDEQGGSPGGVVPALSTRYAWHVAAPPAQHGHPEYVSQLGGADLSGAEHPGFSTAQVQDGALESDRSWSAINDETYAAVQLCEDVLRHGRTEPAVAVG